MRLIVVRHGETLWNTQKRTQGTTDTNLTQKGEEQALLLARRVSMMEVDYVITSPLQRAHDTARAIANLLDKPLCIDDDLIEIRFGAWEGLTFDEIGQRFPQELAVWNRSPLLCHIPDAESVSHVVERVDEFLARMMAEHADETVVAVTHSLPSKLIVARSIGLAVENVHSIRIDNTSLTILDYYRDRAVLRLMNDTVHLQDGVLWQTS